MDGGEPFVAMFRRLNELTLRISPTTSRGRWPRTARRMLQRIRRWQIALNLRRDYKAWRTQHEPGPDELKSQCSAPPPGSAPRFIIVQALPGATVSQCQAWITRLGRQTYDAWQAWLGVPAGHLEELESSLSDEGAPIAQVHLFALEGTQQLTGIELARGEHDFLLLLDPDMLLSPDALWQFAQYSSGRPSTDWIYTDQDLMDGGERRSPWFKPDWSPELLWSMDFVLPAAIRGLPPGMNWRTALRANGWWDHAALLDCLPGDGQRIGHLPRVLFHRLASAQHLKSLITREEAGRANHKRWIETRLKAIGAPSGRVESGGGDWPRVVWSGSTPSISIIIPSAGEAGLLERCIRSLLEITDYPSYEIRVVVAAGSAPKFDLDPPFADARVSIQENPRADFNYSQANNYGARSSKHDLLLFLNDDIEALHPDWLREMTGWIQQTGIGIVGAKLLYPEGTIQHDGVVLGMGGHAAHIFQGAPQVDDGPFGSTMWYRDVSAVTGACMLIGKDLFAALGGFDEGYQLVYSDIDLCLRAIERGQRVMVTPFARLLHHEGRSRGLFMSAADMQRAMVAFLPSIRAGDPYFNPNLSYSSAQPRLELDDEDRVERVARIVARASKG